MPYSSVGSYEMQWYLGIQNETIRLFMTVLPLKSFIMGNLIESLKTMLLDLAHITTMLIYEEFYRGWLGYVIVLARHSKWYY
jgi:hypothetical protein